ncbi:MAG: GGDEF domain-containing protein [Burkholderiales bacterium]
MEEKGNGAAHAPHLRRSYLGAGAAAVMALVLALAAVLELIEPEVAAEGTIALAALVIAFYGLLRSGFSLRFSDPSLTAAQLAAAFLLLAYLTYRTEDAPAALAVLYLVAMLYGVLRLERMALVVLAAVALVAHGTALFMLIDHGHRIQLVAAWTQFGALAAALFWFAYCAGSVLRLRAHLAEAHRRLHDLAQESKDKASRDALTGAFHRHHLIEALEREVSRADRVGKPVSVARVDLDRFRSVNDEFGIAAGDKVLKRFATVAHGAIRDVDVFGRYGGKEFLLIMPDTDLKGAVIATERLRAALEHEYFSDLRGKRRITCTIGVSQHNMGKNASLVLGRAETALNYGRAAGRDRIIALGEDGKPFPLEGR